MARTRNIRAHLKRKSKHPHSTQKSIAWGIITGICKGFMKREGQQALRKAAARVQTRLSPLGKAIRSLHHADAMKRGLQRPLDPVASTTSSSILPPTASVPREVHRDFPIHSNLSLTLCLIRSR
jgi:hypothetical protein